MANKLAVGLVLALVGMAGAARAASDVTGVKLEKTAGGGCNFTIQGSNLGTPKVIRTLSNDSYVLEFNANLRTTRAVVQVNTAGVKTLTYGWFSNRPPKVRVVLKLDDSIKPTLGKQGNNWVISVPSLGTSTQQVTASKTVAPKPVAPKPNPVPTSTKSGVPNLPYPTDALPIPGEGYVPKKTAVEHTLPVLNPETANAGKSTFDPSVWSAGTNSTTTTMTANQSTAGQVKPQPTPPKAVLVSLDFVSTDIIQILKALSIQSDVNIVTSPDVSPTDKPVKLTVSLHGVSLDDALSYITAIAGLRYGKVANTFIVTPAGTFSEAMRMVMERSGSKYETRVVNLMSGDAAKIREATMHALPPSGSAGFYEIIVPSKAEVVTATQTGAAGATATTGTQGTPVPQPTPTPTNSKSYYLMIVADSKRVEEIETYVRSLDSKIIETSSFRTRSTISTVVVPVQSGETGRIKMMLDRLVADHPRSSEFTINESILDGTTKGEAQTMALLMAGPGEDLARLEEFAMALDKELCSVMGKTFAEDRAGLEKVWTVVDVMYVEPTLLELDLKSRFKGLQISLVPDAVTPGLGGKTSSSSSSSSSAGGDDAMQAGGKGGQQSSTQNETSEKSITGREPMRMALRGTRGEIEQAKEYIAMIDVAPRQIAMELRVMEMTKEDATRIGLDWNVFTGGRLTSFRINQGLGDKIDTPGTIGTGDTKSQPLDSSWFLATLDSLNGGRNIIARPNALVSDGRQTRLFVGDTVRYIKTIQSTQNGTTVETGEVQVGVTFNIDARIGGDGQIALNLDQNFSILTGFTPVPGGGNLPQTSDRITNMFVNMRSGETLAIGGLILEQDRKTVNGIPLLKDLPILGYLFSRQETRKQRTEIVFFLTAKVVDASTRAAAAQPVKEAVTEPVKSTVKTSGIKSNKGGVRLD